jgi:sulfate permease, SulP family
MIEIGQLRRMARFRRSELALALASAVAVVVLGVLWGIVAAIALSFADLLRRIARPHDALLGYLPGQAERTTSATALTGDRCLAW